MGGGNGNQTTQTQSVPPWLQNYASGFLGQAAGVAGLPYTPYTGQRVADLSPTQASAISGLGRIASGLPSQHAADSMLTRTLEGGYQNPFGRGSVTPGTNQYIGENPHFRSSVDRAVGDITRHYERAISPERTRQANLSGVFGGGAHQEMIRRDQETLARQIGDTVSGMYGQQYDRSANLAESHLGRDLQSQMFGANLGSQAHENERNRQLGAVGAATGLAGGASQNLVNAMNAGGLEQRHFQNLLDSQYGDFMDWRNYPDTRVGLFGNALGAVLGRAGGTTTTQGPGRDPFAQGLGLMMMGNGMFGGGKGGGGGGAFGA